ncbi:stage III sporulation protein AF [Paenibacillus xanthanilyticus]|uniref:Stage III sporulation protein AF n=1 Tax=Paenibacillus xanthanilyticus TaxID=1783531 RepID=A0ABV8KCQ2_9BACL
MMDWLAGWLRQIIAVVLLAGIVDLLLPNKAMQRYVRLVAGLIILLTILSPIMGVLQGDFGTKLHESFDAWLTSAPDKQYKMPTLQDIQRDAEQMKRKQEDAAAALAEKNLAAAMAEEITKKTGLAVERVKVTLERSGSASEAKLASVAVALIPPEETSSADVSGERPIGEVGAVQPVEIDVNGARATGDDGDEGGTARQEAVEAFSPVDQRRAEAVRQALSDAFGVHPSIVSISGFEPARS